MINYSVAIFANDVWETVAFFQDKAKFDAIIAFCVNQFESSSSAENIAIIDTDTGEVLWNWCDDWDNDDYDDEPYDSPYDELNYDPYMGCDFYDCSDSWYD